MKNIIKTISSLAKTRLTNLVVITTLCGAAVAPGSLSWISWLVLLVATWGLVGAANAVNCYLERDTDRLMERTKDRPLATGQLSPRLALWSSLAVASASIFLLHLFANEITAVLGFLAFILYVGVYTPLKRLSLTALFVGAVPGAIPPMMGWTAVRGEIELGAWILFGILFFWQLPHFIAISLNRQTEYDRAGLKTIPGSLGVASAQKHMLFYSLLMIFTSFLPYQLGLAGSAYLWTTAAFGMAFLALCFVGFFKLLKLNWNRVIFLGSIIYLPVVLGVWVLDLWLQRLT